MADFGFSVPLGFVSPTLEQLNQQAVDLYFDATGIVIDLQQTSPSLDQALAIARIFKPAWDDQAGTYDSGFVGSASGAGLQNLISPFVGAPLPDVGSSVVLPLTGVATTNVPAGSTAVLNGDGPNAAPWVLQAPVVIPGDGTFVYSVPGPKSAIALNVWSIATPVVGWADAGPNVADAALGRIAETELEYKQRFRQSVDGTRIVAAVAQVTGVTNVALFENFTDIPDVFWGATHWFEVLVTGGSAIDIGNAIQGARAYTVQPLGTEFIAVPFVNAPGGTVVMRYSIPAPIPVWVDVTITKGEDYSKDTSAAAVIAREEAIQNQIVAWGELRRAGLDLFSGQAEAITLATPSVPGIGNAVVLIGLAPAPALTFIQVADRDILDFDPSRITVNGA